MVRIWSNLVPCLCSNGIKKSIMDLCQFSIFLVQPNRNVFCAMEKNPSKLSDQSHGGQRGNLLACPSTNLIVTINLWSRLGKLTRIHPMRVFPHRQIIKDFLSFLCSCEAEKSQQDYQSIQKVRMLIEIDDFPNTIFICNARKKKPKWKHTDWLFFPSMMPYRKGYKTQIAKSSLQFFFSEENHINWLIRRKFVLLKLGLVVICHISSIFRNRDKTFLFPLKIRKIIHKERIFFQFYSMEYRNEIKIAWWVKSLFPVASFIGKIDFWGSWVLWEKGGRVSWNYVGQLESSWYVLFLILQKNYNQ